MSNIEYPTPHDYPHISPFRFWCQKVLPLVYDDSLSYYELLCKVVEHLNKVADDLNNMGEDISTLYNFVNDYYKNLDVQAEINNKLDAMALDGTLTSILQPTIAEEVTQWLTTNITNPTNPPIDKTLTVGDSAADAEVVGDKLAYKLDTYGYKNVHANNIDFVKRGNNLYNGGKLYVGRINGTNGEIRKTSASYVTTDFIYIGDKTDKYLIAEKNNAKNSNAHAFYNKNMEFISGKEATTTEAITIPENSVWCRVSYTSTTTPNQIMITTSNSTDNVPLELPTGVIDADYIPREYLGKQINVKYGAELNTLLSDWSAINGATFAEEKWVLENGQYITKAFNLTAGNYYHIELDIENAYTPNDTISKLVLSLDTNSITIFGANDGTWNVDLQCVNNAAIIKIGGDNWNGDITGISVKEILANPTPIFKLNHRNFNITASNINVGGGQEKISSGIANACLGINAQNDINTGTYNNAHGFYAQSKVTVGSSNNAFGSNAQRELTTGMYNNAVGSSAQRYIKDGCWNVAVGNEAQRDIVSGCNNVGIGRRSQNSITNGNKNVCIGAQAGFVRDGASNVAITTEDGNTAIGYQSGMFKAGSMNGTSVGREASAGTNGIAIGFNVDADDNEIVIGNNNNNVVKIGGKTITFNLDGSVTWS